MARTNIDQRGVGAGHGSGTTWATSRHCLRAAPGRGFVQPICPICLNAAVPARPPRQVADTKHSTMMRPVPVSSIGGTLNARIAHPSTVPGAKANSAENSNACCPPNWCGPAAKHRQAQGVAVSSGAMASQRGWSAATPRRTTTANGPGPLDKKHCENAGDLARPPGLHKAARSANRYR